MPVNKYLCGAGTGKQAGEDSSGAFLACAALELDGSGEFLTIFWLAFLAIFWLAFLAIFWLAFLAIFWLAFLAIFWPVQIKAAANERVVL